MPFRRTLDEMTALLSMPPPSEVEKKCPHADIRFCPLYHASHEATGHGCDDGRLAEGGCGTSRTYNYGTLLAALVKISPGLVAQCALLENAEMPKAQRARNQKNLGLH